MRAPLGLLLAILALAACNVRRREAAVDSARIAESIAAAESARVVEPAVRPPPPMTLTASGDQEKHFARDSGFQVFCTASESGGERLLQVEGMIRGAHVSFVIYNATDGSLPVGNNYTRRRAKSRVGNLEVFVGSHGYTDGRGRAEITDPYGRTGSISATNFIKMGVKKCESHRADLSVRLRWRCE